MPELLSCSLSRTQLSKTKQEEESLGTFLFLQDVMAAALIFTVGMLKEKHTGFVIAANVIVSMQVCMTCIRCKSCGVTPGKSWDTDWNHDKGLCPDCSKLYEQGEETISA